MRVEDLSQADLDAVARSRVPDEHAALDRECDDPGQNSAGPDDATRAGAAPARHKPGP